MQILARAPGGAHESLVCSAPRNFIASWLNVRLYLDIGAQCLVYSPFVANRGTLESNEHLLLDFNDVLFVTSFKAALDESWLR